MAQFEHWLCKLTSNWWVDWTTSSLCDRYGVCVRYNLLWFLPLCVGRLSICERVVGSEFAFLASTERAEAHHRSDFRVDLHLRIHDLEVESKIWVLFGEATRENVGVYVRQAVSARALDPVSVLWKERQAVGSLNMDLRGQPHMQQL